MHTFFYNVYLAAILTLMLSIFFNTNAFANGNNGATVVYSDPISDIDKSVEIEPFEPLSYKPFTVEVRLLSYETKNVSIDIDISERKIILQVVTRTIHFTEPPAWLVTDIQGLPEGDYTIEVYTAPEDEGFGVKLGETSFSIVSDYITQPAYTFFHPEINYYFVTAGEDEAESVRTNGWRNSDDGFNVWPADGPAPDAALPVCRFYSSLVNSHFYTASEEECDYLQSFDSGWEYEGIAFRALVPTAGACATGTTPVWRLYNNRAAEQDSNHRFVASAETYRTMIADGWVGEGVAFCSPPSASE